MTEISLAALWAGFAYHDLANGGIVARVTSSDEDSLHHQEHCMTIRSPAETVAVYLEQLYNQGQVEMAGELVADPTWRHQDGTLTALSLADTIERLKHNFTRWPTMRFDTNQLLVDGDKVAVAWNGFCTKPDGDVLEMYGIEIFRVQDGKIVEIWNSKEWPGLWQASPLD